MSDRVTPPKLRRRRLSEELTSQLRKHIIDEGLKPGDPLLTEQEMVERFGVSRSVVREATKALDFLGIIDAAPRRGMILDKFNFDRVNEYFGFHFALCDYPPKKLLRARVVIETGAAYYIVEAIKSDPDLLGRLRELAEAHPRDPYSSHDRWIEYDMAFHRGLVAASDISPLASFCDLLQVFFHKYRVAPRRWDYIVKRHLEIVTALARGDVDASVDLLRKHIQGYFDRNLMS
jgi:GntR family transcriptional regulator, transcriptional repressor for pyruvate dehydrogenase complex